MNEDAAYGLWPLVVIGLGTALHANVVGRVQTDLKSLLAYASMTQASLILVEIGLGWRIVPLVHVVGHAIVRDEPAQVTRVIREGCTNPAVEAFILTGGTGGSGQAGKTVAMHLYSVAFTDGDFGTASAIAWLLFMLIAGATWLNKRLLGQRD